jgi:four helix bundle protein
VRDLDGIDGVMELIELTSPERAPLMDAVEYLPVVAEGRAEYDAPPRSHRDLKVYRRAFDLAMAIFRLSKAFPSEERFSLTDQGRRSSRAVCANIAEAWRRRRYKAAFINSLNLAEAEAGESQVWVEFAAECGYVDKADAKRMIDEYDLLLKTIIAIIAHADKWVIKTKT